MMIAMTLADKKIIREMGPQIAKSTSHIRALVEAQPEGLRTEIVILVNLWDWVWDMRKRDVVHKSLFLLQVKNAGAAMAIENREKDRESDLWRKGENAAMLLGARPQMAVDAAEAFIDYWASLKIFEDEKVQVRINFILALDALLKGSRAKTLRSLIRGEGGLNFADKISLFSRHERPSHAKKD
jgi:hypothetical protein